MTTEWIREQNKNLLIKLPLQIDFLTDDCPGGYIYLTSGWKTNSQTYLQPDNFGHT